MDIGAFDINRGLRVGYLALVVFLLSFLARRGVDALRDHVHRRPCFAFDPQRLRIEPRPTWVGARFDRTLIQSVSHLRGCSVLHPDFRPALKNALAAMPWIQSVAKITVESGQRVGARARFRRPVARLDAGSHYLDDQGVVVPEAGVALRVPWVRSLSSETLDPVQRLVAGQEAAFLLDRTGAQGGFWDSLEGIELTSELRRDGRRYSRMQLVFRRDEEPGFCRLMWGRGRVEARPADLDAESKYRNAMAVLEAFPGWRSVDQAHVFVQRPTIRRADGPPGSLDAVVVSGPATGP